MRASQLFLTFLLIISTSGCIKFDLDLTINKDSTVSGTMIFAVSNSLSELGDDQTPATPTEDLVDPNAKGVTVEPYDDGDFVGQKITLDSVPFSEFSSGGESGDLTIVRDGDLITLKGFLDLGEDTSQSTTEDELGGILGKAFVDSLFASADLSVRITFPFEVVSTTGNLSEDRKSVTWKPDIGEKLDLTTTVRIPSFNLVLYGSGAITLLILIGALVVVAKRRQRKASPSASIADSTQIEK